MRILQSDWVRALGALTVAVGGAAHIVTSRADSGVKPSPEPVVYSVLNMTERMADRQACPLDLRDVRETLEAGYAARGYQLEFSPLAEGPEVLLHEMSANLATSTGSAAPACAWTVTISFQGRSQTNEALIEPTQTPVSFETFSAEPHPLISAPAR